MFKKIAMAACFVLLAGAASADPIEGTWQTQPDEGSFAYVRIAPCGNAYCGTITRTFQGTREYQSENVGLQIVIDMVPQGGGNYRGRVLRPADRKVYNGRAELNGDRMTLSGCVAGGLICRNQTWARIN